VISFLPLGKISKHTDDLRTDRDWGSPFSPRSPQNPGENGDGGSPKFYDTGKDRRNVGMLMICWQNCTYQLSHLYIATDCAKCARGMCSTELYSGTSLIRTPFGPSFSRRIIEVSSFQELMI
jgi:hypothetical protein